jgi:NAD(P)-dependent dehydrogenase (short-subunit alcohol dehydrogenase family)
VSAPLQVRDFQAGDVPDQAGRTVVVTGANSGLGLQTSTVLASRGARVLMACRNPDKARTALAQVSARATGPAPETVSLDLADLSSVRAAAEQVAGLTDHVDVLVNNAGVMAVPKRRTADGFEMQLGTNHLGHALLVDRLLPQLLAADAPRVVVESSIAHRQGSIHLADPNYEHRRYFRWSAYGQSKLANLLFSAELARRAAATPLVVLAAHPGVAATSLTDNIVPPVPGLRAVVGAAIRSVLMSDAGGALSQLYAATMPDVVPDDYLGPTGPGEARGPVGRVGRSAAASDPTLAAELWDVTARLTGATFDTLR